MFRYVALERITVKLPAGFDPARHAKALPAAVAKSRGDGGWEIESIDTNVGTATLTRQAVVMEVREGTDADPEAFEIRLPVGTRPADGDKVAARQSDAHPGYHLVRFEPHVGKAILAKLTDDELRCRGSIANALGVKPWEVDVKKRMDGGFAVQLPGVYTPSKHDEKLQEVAETIIGKLGWYFTVDPKTLVAQVIPADPPTFEPLYRFDFASAPASSGASLPDKERFSLPLGVSLGRPGKRNAALTMDLSDTVGTLLVGLAGSGKSTAVQSVIFNALARGFRLALINTIDKKTDMEWAKPFVEPHMWGCESVAESVVVAKLVNEEGARLGELLAEHGVAKWQDLPASVKFQRENMPLLLVADELAALLTADPLPPGLPREVKALPEFVEMQQNLLESKLLATTLSLGPSLYRAAGNRFIFLTQQPNERYGFSTKLKGNLPHRVMLGVGASRAEKGHAFRTPEKVPDVPEWISSDDSRARGVGVAHMDGQGPAVFKGFWASLDDYLDAMKCLGLPTTSDPRPTAEQVSRMVPRIDAGDELDEDDEPLTAGEERLPSGKPISSLPPEFGPIATYGADGRKLKGAAAAAAAASRQITDKLPTCPSCDKPIQPNGDCGCSW